MYASSACSRSTADELDDGDWAERTAALGEVHAAIKPTMEITTTIIRPY
jgi:hypothetical protein